MTDNGIGSLRRYYLLKRLTSLESCDGLDGVWRSKQEEISGTEFPLEFPFRSQLATAGYVAREDLDVGADADELVRYAGLSSRQAAKVIAAHAAL